MGVFGVFCGLWGQWRILLKLGDHLSQETRHRRLRLLQQKEIQDVDNICVYVCNLDPDGIKPYMIPVVQSWQVDSSFGIYMFALSNDHVSSGSQEAYGRSEGKWVHQPQLNGEVVGATLG